MHSLLQFARPAVEFSFLFQMIWTPPLDAANSPIWPFVTFESSSWRKSSANWCFRDSKSFLAWMADLSFFVGLFLGDVDGEGASESLSESGVIKRFFFGEARTFLGDHCSFQSFTTSWDQNASMSGCRGAVGIFAGLLLVGELSIFCFGELGGGVDGRAD